MCKRRKRAACILKALRRERRAKAPSSQRRSVGPHSQGMTCKIKRRAAATRARAEAARGRQVATQRPNSTEGGHAVVEVEAD
eukprot:14522138-Alexandrium_andersonii.AAC.1